MSGEEPGFSTLKEVFGNSVSYINSIETELSSDPLMVRGISELNKVSVISNSDSHSTNFHRLGREVTLLSFNKPKYQILVDSIKRNKIIKTYEITPESLKFFLIAFFYDLSFLLMLHNQNHILGQAFWR